MLLPCQSTRITGFPQTRTWHLAVGIQSLSGQCGQMLGAKCCFCAAKRTFLPAPAPNGQKLTISARAESEDDWFKKRSSRGSCDFRLNPSRSAVPECEAPWPRPIPAFKACFCWCTTSDAGDDTRDSKNPACHTCSRRFVFYTTMQTRVQGDFVSFSSWVTVDPVQCSCSIDQHTALPSLE